MDPGLLSIQGNREPLNITWNLENIFYGLGIVVFAIIIIRLLFGLAIALIAGVLGLVGVRSGRMLGVEVLPKLVDPGRDLVDESTRLTSTVTSATEIQY